MKRLLLTTCAVAALCGTGFAQSPTNQEKNAPDAKPGMSAQPAQLKGSQADKSGNQAPAKKSATPAGNTGASADKSAAPADKAASPADKPSDSTAKTSPDNKTAAQPGATAAAPQKSVTVTFYTVKPADVQASTLIGATVYNVNNESIGEIEDIVIDNQKALRAVVIGVGGFLGMGEHDVAVEPSALLITQNTDNEDIRIVLNTTKDDLKSAPAVKFDKKSRVQAAATDDASKQPSKPADTTGAATNEKDAPAKAGMAKNGAQKDGAKSKSGMGKPDDAMDKSAGGMKKPQ